MLSMYPFLGSKEPGTDIRTLKPIVFCLSCHKRVSLKYVRNLAEKTSITDAPEFVQPQ